MVVPCLLSSPRTRGPIFQRPGNWARSCLIARPVVMGPRLRGDDTAVDWSKNKTHRAEAAELVRVDQHAPLLDAKAVAGALEHITIDPDIFPDTLVAAVAVADEVGGDADEIAVDAEEAHVRDHPP